MARKPYRQFVHPFVMTSLFLGIALATRNAGLMIMLVGSEILSLHLHQRDLPGGAGFFGSPEFYPIGGFIWIIGTALMGTRGASIAMLIFSFLLILTTQSISLGWHRTRYAADTPIENLSLIFVGGIATFFCAMCVLIAQQPP